MLLSVGEKEHTDVYILIVKNWDLIEYVMMREGPDFWYLFLIGDDMGKRDSNQNRKIVNIIKDMVIIVAIIIAVVIYVREHIMNSNIYELEMKGQENEQKKEEYQQEEEEKKKNPQLSAVIDNIVMQGGEKYWTICLLNENSEIDIKNGEFVVECCIRELGRESNVNYYLKNAIFEEQVEYLEELDGTILLLREDYQEFSEIVREELQKQGVEVSEEVEFQTYLFIYYDYTCEGKNLSGYYEVEIKRNRCGAVEEISNPESYFDVCVIEL